MDFQHVAAQFLPRLVDLLSQDEVTFRADASALPYLEAIGNTSVSPASPDDFDTEWLAFIVGLKVMDSLKEVVGHSNTYSTGHSDGILTRGEDHPQRFVAEVNSAAVYVNASTRFTDGG